MIGRIRVVAMIGLILAGCAGCWSQVLTPAVTVNLRGFGWRKMVYPKEAPDPGSAVPHRLVADGAGHVYAGFLVRGAVRVHERGELTDTFRIIEFDARTGQALRTLNLPIRNLPTNGGVIPELFLSARGTVVAWLDGRLDVVAGQHQGAQFSVTHLDDWIERSPSGGTLLAFAHPKDGPSEEEMYVLDSDTLTVRQKCTLSDDGRAPDAISDSFEYFLGAGPAAGTRVLERARFCGSKRPVQELSGLALSISFLSDSTYLTAGHRNFGMGRIGQGEIFHVGPLPSHQGFGFMWRSGNGSRAAVARFITRPGSLLFHIDDSVRELWIDVYDLKSHRRMGSFQLPPVDYSHPSVGDSQDLAFSPDGRSLAALDRGTLQIFRTGDGSDASARHGEARQTETKK